MAGRVDLSGADLTGADVTGATLSEIKHGTGTKIFGAVFDRAEFALAVWVPSAMRVDPTRATGCQ
jgi:uncharacterized protein YjbI with pentapeptide repeats